MDSDNALRGSFVVNRLTVPRCLWSLGLG